MHHLNAETLARLVDERPAADESAHLAGCAVCAGELDALKQQTASLRELPDPVMPDLLRKRIALALEAEPMSAPAVPRTMGAWTSIAAGVALFVLGGAAGTWVVAPNLAPGGGPATAAFPLAANADPATEAASALAAAEAEYMNALARFARLNYSDDGMDPLSRLAALEGIVLTTRSALREAPADPVINGYHLTALGQRDELLRRIEGLESAGDEWF